VLPVPPLDLEDPETFHPREADATAPTVQALVVEDLGYNQLILADVIRSLGCETSVLSNCQQVIKEYEYFHNKIDYIVCDLQMPMTDGIRAAEKIRAFEKENGLHETPIIHLVSS
jgi:CheY-like chemotaxis protein